MERHAHTDDFAWLRKALGEIITEIDRLERQVANRERDHAEAAARPLTREEEQ